MKFFFFFFDNLKSHINLVITWMTNAGSPVAETELGRYDVAMECTAGEQVWYANCIIWFLRITEVA
jgi:hypothetical protein